MHPVRKTSPDGVDYRDLNGNDRMDPFEDPRLASRSGSPTCSRGSPSRRRSA